MRIPSQPVSSREPVFAVGSVAVVATVIVVAWLRPDLSVAAAALAAGLLALGPGAISWRAGLTAVFVGVFLFGKDLLPADTARQWSWLGELPGAPEISRARQPALDLAALSAATWAGGLVWWAGVRQVMAAERAARVFLTFVGLTGAALAVWLLVAPAAAESGGRSFAFGAVQSRNAIGAALAMAAMVAAGGAIEAGRRREVNGCAGWIALGAAAAFAAVASGSRGAWLALVAGVVVLTWGAGLLRRGRVSILSVVVAAVGLILWLQPQAAARVGEIGEEYRWQIWRAAAQVATDHAWLGAGGGMFEPVFAWYSGLQPPVGATIRHPDSSVVLLGFELGLLGVAVVLSALIFLWTERRGETRGDEAQAGRWGARAAVVAWLVAGAFDISWHRPALLALAVPLVGVAWPAGGASRGNRWLGVFLAGAVLGVAVWTGARERSLRELRGPTYAGGGGAVRLTEAGAQVLRMRPLAVEWQHRLGREAFIAGGYPLAARHWRMVLELQPANEEGIRAYARALQRPSPADALPFWEHYFRHAEERAAARFESTLNELGRTDTAFWRAAIRARPELLVLLADEDRPEARAAFGDWMRLDLRQRVQVPMRYVVVAFARWGEAPEFGAWIEAAPRWPWGEGLQAAQTLLEGGRSDLAWPLLTRMVRRPAPVAAVTRSVGRELLARVQPGDYARLAEALGPGGLTGTARVAALQAAVARTDCPAWFRVELAYSLAAEGRRIEAGGELWRAARQLADAQPGDW